MKTWAKTYLVAFMFALAAGACIAGTESRDSADPSGYLSLGVRNSLGFFVSDGVTFPGTSVGGVLGMQITKNIASHWFGDYITTGFNDLARRTDVHGGFSLMPSFGKGAGSGKKIFAFPLAGFCIDYTKISVTNGHTSPEGERFAERYSFATQLGLGAGLKLSERVIWTIESHYMLHIGTDLDVLVTGDDVEIKRSSGANLEGHFLFAMSIEYRMFRLW